MSIIYKTDGKNKERIFHLRELIVLKLIRWWQNGGRDLSIDLSQDLDPVRSFSRQRGDSWLTRKYFPTLVETFLETVRRLRIMEQFLQFFRANDFGVILGGGLSYGKFYCVRQDSDIDLLIIVPEDQKLLRKILTWFWSETILVDIGIFLRGGADIFTYKGLSIKGVDVSVHFILKETLEKFAPRELSGAEDDDFGIKFRNTNFDHPDYSQNNFSGKTVSIPKAVRKIEEGFLCRFPFWAIRDGRFYPGIFSNLILPCGEAMKDIESRQASMFVSNFFKFLRRRLAVERKDVENPKSLKLCLAHPRYPIFPKYVLNKI